MYIYINEKSFPKTNNFLTWYIQSQQYKLSAIKNGCPGNPCYNDTPCVSVVPGQFHTDRSQPSTDDPYIED